jgi:hypothetical protein
MTQGDTSVRWLGASGLEFRVCDKVLLVDPFFSRLPLHYLLFGRAEADDKLVRRYVPRCDYVFVTHSHYDHVMDVPTVALETGAIVYGSHNVCKILALHGVGQEQFAAIGAGDCLDVGPFRVEVLPARHLPLPGFGIGPLRDGLRVPLRLRDYRLDEVFSFQIQLYDLRMLVWRSMDATGAQRADILFVQPRGPKALFDELFARTQAQVVVPIEWDNYFRSLSRPLRAGLDIPRWSWPPVRRVDLKRFGAWIEILPKRRRLFVPRALVDYRLAVLLDPFEPKRQGRPQ